LSTVSAELRGYPFGSVTPYCLDAAGVPVLLLSHLSQHTRNLLEEPRAALTVVDDFEGDVQEAARLTAVGRIEPLVQEDATAERYFRYFPQGRFYREALNFRFFSLAPERWHWNGGFATARWFGNDRLLRPNPFAGETEATMIARIESDHRDVLERFACAKGPEQAAEAAIRVCGLDAEGMDIGVGARVVRIPFPHSVTGAGELRELLVELAGDRPV
jgi:putative heme iron utilization protein